MNQRKPKPDLPGSRTARTRSTSRVYPCKPHRGDYLLFLGRMSPDKGAHRAVAVAIEAGLPLKLAGKMREPTELAYFDEFVEPHLARRDRVPRRGHARREGRAAAERARDALPDRVGGAVRPRHDRVDGLRHAGDRDARGAVPEVIEDGRSGIIVDDYRDMAGALERRTRSSRSSLRRYAEERFSPERMVDDYLRAFEAAIAAAE